ncbi:MAG TPA: site-2 protease family protein [Pirellulales bacterium]|nr:site-2 protease family protein [Pirellulales bacterium]
MELDPLAPESDADAVPAEPCNAAPPTEPVVGAVLELVVPTIVADPPAPAIAPPICTARRPRPKFWRLQIPSILFVSTALSTFWVAATNGDLLGTVSDFWRAATLVDFAAPFRPIAENWWQGVVYMAAVMGILLAHEMGHYLQARRYHVPASLPYFIPMPISPLGTMGAVIGMRGSQADRKQLFDIGLTGPWAGLAVAMPLAWAGIRSATALPFKPEMEGTFGDPLIFQFLIAWLRPDDPPGTVLIVHANPLVMASWVGMLVTGLNMLPIGQLDGGHVTYALFGRRAHWVALASVAVAMAFIVVAGRYEWTLMLALIMLLGTRHPPTADDRVELGRFRKLVGWFSLAIPVFCLTPFPFMPR